MKKLLLTLSAMSLISVASAATSTATLQLTGTVASSCSTSLTSSTLAFTFVPGQVASPQNTELQFACTAGSVLQTLDTQSNQGWQFNGASTGSKISYSVANLGVNAPYSSVASNLSTTWSSAVGSLTANPVLNSPITIDSNADPLLISLQVTPSITPANAAVDSYSDTITFTAVY